ncbi:MAG TPA: cation:proton antiporter [Acidimicrobiales bacterium]|nr:cation:proton antiporter [Acidimicrobiales bacterium]
MSLVAAAQTNAGLVFIELGAIGVMLAVLARLAGRLRITAIPLYLVAGLAFGRGGIAPLDVSADFLELASEIGVLLLLLTLGLEYTAEELRQGLRSGATPGAVDAIVNFCPGFVAGLILGWGPTVAVLLGGVTWVSSSGVASKVLSDLDRLECPETPAILNLLVIEDLAMAAYLPVVAAVVAGQDLGATVTTVAIALVAVALILAVALRWGHHLSRVLAGGSDEALLLAVFGLTLLVGGLAQEIHVSAAIGAFLIGLALSGPTQARVGPLIEPLRDLFAATFFLFFSFQIDPTDLVGVVVPATVLALLTIAGKLISGRAAARSLGVGERGWRRAGATLIAHGEFSIVIASLGASLKYGPELGALAAAYVLLTALIGPLAAKYADRIPARQHT